MRSPWLLALILWLTPILAIAYDPPPFDPSRDLILVPPNATVPGSRAVAERELDRASVRIFAVVAEKARDPRHRSLGWSSETEAAIERTWEAWATAEGFDAARDVLVLVALDEREVRIRTGSTWDADYGLHTDVLTAITDENFVPLARAGNLYAAIARTVRATDQRLSSLTALAPTLPEPTDQTVAIWPPSPVLPRVSPGRRSFSPLPVDVTVHIAQRLPDGADPARIVEGLRPSAPEGLTVLWDVRGRTIVAAGGSEWSETDVDHLVDRLMRGGRDREGHLVSTQLGLALRSALDARRRLAQQREVEDRRIGRPAATAHPRLWAYPETEAWSRTQAAVDKLPDAMHVVVVAQADRERQRVAPDGTPWLDHATEGAFGAGMPRGAKHVAIIVDPWETQLTGRALRLEDGSQLPIAPPRAGSPPTDASPDEAAAAHVDALAASIQASMDQRQAALDARKRDQRITWIAVTLVILLLLLGVAAWALIGSANRRRSRFFYLHADLGHAIAAARDRYAALRVDTELTARVRALRGRGPVTTALFAEIGAELDSIEIGLRVLERRLSESEPLALQNSAWLWRFDVEGAIDALEGPVEIAAPPDGVDLFAPVEATASAPLRDFMDHLRDSYTTVRAGWDRLVGGVNASLHPIAAEIEAADLDGLDPRIAEAGLPPRWKDRHPLIANSAEHAQLDALRREDPVAYHDALVALRDATAAYLDDLREIGAALSRLDAARAAAEHTLARAPFDAVVRPDDDPQTAVLEARVRDAAARHAVDEAEDPERTLALIRATVEAWREVVQRRARIDVAVATTAERLTVVRSRVQRCRARQEQLQTLLTRDIPHHLGTPELQDRLQTLDLHLSSAEQELRAAAEAVQERRHVDALRWEEGVVPVLTEAEAELSAIETTAQAAKDAEARARSLLPTVTQRREVLVGASSANVDALAAEMAAPDEHLRRIRALIASQEPLDWAMVASVLEGLPAAWNMAVYKVEERERLARIAAVRHQRVRRSSRRSSSTSSGSSRSSSSWSSSSSSSSWSSSSSRSGGSSWSSSSGRSGGSSWSSSSSSRSSGGRSGGSRC